MSNAVNMMLNEQGCGAGDCYGNIPKPNIEIIAGWIDNYFKYTEKKCVPYNGQRTEINWLPEHGYDLAGNKTKLPLLTVAYNFDRGDASSDVCFYKLNNGVNIGISRDNVFSTVGGSVLYIVMDANGKQGPNRLGKDVFIFTSSPSLYSSSHNHTLSAEFAMHAWASDSRYGGQCGATWAYIKKICPVNEKTPTLYVLTHSKLPDLTKIGYPAKP